MTCESCLKKDEIISELRKHVERLEKRIEKLEKLLNLYHNPHTPPSKKPFPSRKPKSNGKPGQKNGHKGVTRPEPEPDETIAVTAEACPDCGCTLGKPTAIESRIIEDLPEPRQAKVTEFLLAHYLCPNCNKEIVASHPECPEEGRFGKNLISLATVMKYLDRLPYRKIRRALKRQNLIELSGATILDLTRRAADVMRPEYQSILERIRKALVAYSDETSIMVNGKRCWIWVFVSGNDVIVVVADSRGKKVVEETLGEGFKGIVVCDGWRAYTGFTDRIQRCWAHLLREADALSEQHKEAVQIAEELHSIFADCKKILDKDPPPDLREQLWKAMNARMRLLVSKNCETMQVRKFMAKITNGFGHWFTFILHPGVEPTNNIAENALRENVVQRNIIKTLRNGKGMYLHETSMSVLTTWENMGLNAYDELVKLL